MTSKLKYLFSILIILYSLFFFNTSVFAADDTKVIDEPIACSLGGCPSDLTYPQGEKCVTNYTEFKKNPVNNHYWITDQAITSQGKADERARQFIYWVISRSAIDNHPVLKQIWNTTRNVSYFFTILIAALLGLSIIVARRTNFDLKIGVWPAIGKIFMALLFITFSASIVLLLIQLSEILMKFFAESLGGKDLFNIYFTNSVSPENNYKDFIGCRDLNFRVQEAMSAEVFVLKLTNITYYVMGTMLLLRKIILWFLLFVSPFIAILFSFSFIRNVGWIWIGVFFQWLFYGPLFSIFLGAMAMIWKTGIPFAFDFSRTGKNSGYVYPTAINILYGGPAQQLSTLNNGNYIDTFVEYIITLIMLWAVTFLPWWLLRIFRDYCCDGIAAMKNILMSMYDQARGGNPPQAPGPIPIISNIGSKLQIPREVNVPVSVKLETIEEIKRTKTEQISQSLNLTVSKLTDIARVETNKQTRETVSRNLQYLTNPVKAETPTQRQKYMNIRTELFNRAVKEDRIARQILTATSSSRVEQMEKRQEILKNIPQAKISSSVTNAVNSVISNISSVANVAKLTQTTSEQVQNVLNSFTKNATTSPTKITETITKETGIPQEKVATILKTTAQTQTNQQVVKQMVHAVEPEKHVEETIAVPPTVALEDYEEVKKMWREQYEKGEVPVTENITSRQQWVDQDTILVTNTLNKLLSADPQIKNQGLDDIAYILPIFLINNLKGDELLVYLKAKLEAAKAVKESLDREKEITEKVKAQVNEQFIDIKKPKAKEAEKTMELKKELKIESQNPNVKDSNQV